MRMVRSKATPCLGWATSKSERMSRGAGVRRRSTALIGARCQDAIRRDHTLMMAHREPRSSAVSDAPLSYLISARNRCTRTHSHRSSPNRGRDTPGRAASNVPAANTPVATSQAGTGPRSRTHSHARSEPPGQEDHAGHDITCRVDEKTGALQHSDAERRRCCEHSVRVDRLRHHR